MIHTGLRRRSDPDTQKSGSARQNRRERLDSAGVSRRILPTLSSLQPIAAAAAAAAAAAVHLAQLVTTSQLVGYWLPRQHSLQTLSTLLYLVILMLLVAVALWRYLARLLLILLLLLPQDQALLLSLRLVVLVVAVLLLLAVVRPLSFSQPPKLRKKVSLFVVYYYR